MCCQPDHHKASGGYAPTSLLSHSSVASFNFQKQLTRNQSSSVFTSIYIYCFQLLKIGTIESGLPLRSLRVSALGMLIEKSGE